MQSPYALPLCGDPSVPSFRLAPGPPGTETSALCDLYIYMSKKKMRGHNK